MEDILSILSEYVFFSALGMCRGYQILLDHKSKEYTAFSLGSLYHFNALPFGVVNGATTYQLLMSLVLAGISWEVCIAYIDDLIILGRSFSDHLANLEIVLQHFAEHNLKIKPD